jgi:hypothetical protein
MKRAAAKQACSGGQDTAELTSRAIANRLSTAAIFVNNYAAKHVSFASTLTCAVENRREKRNVRFSF